MSIVLLKALIGDELDSLRKKEQNHKRFQNVILTRKKNYFRIVINKGNKIFVIKFRLDTPQATNTIIN